MAICPKCSKEIEDGIKFCPFCGASTTETEQVNETVTEETPAEAPTEQLSANSAPQQEAPQAAPTQAAPQQAAPQQAAPQAAPQQAPQQAAPKKKKGGKAKFVVIPVVIVLLIAIVLVVLALVVAVVLIFAIPKTVKLNDYMTITSEGYDSIGKANMEFDYDRFEQDYNKKIKLTKKGRDYTNGSYYPTDFDAFYDICVSASLTQSDDLSNGDVIVLNWDVDEQAAKDYFHVKLKYEDITYNVDNLKPVEKFNPFDFITISFSGIDPEGFATYDVDYTESKMNDVIVTIDNNDKLSNGDTITVNVDYILGIDSFAEKHGAILTEMTRDYTVEGLSKYITDISEIPSDAMDKMNKALEDKLDSDFGRSTNVNLKSKQKIGTIVLKAKDDTYVLQKNKVYVVYKVKVEFSGVEVEYYVFACYNNILIKGDGTVDGDLKSFKMPSDSFTKKAVSGNWIHTVTFKGYEDMSTLMSKAITSQTDYDYVTDINY